MHINKTTCHALLITFYLVRNNRVVSSTELADNLQISPRYTSLVAAKLRKGGLISAQLGMSGGYSLSREPSAISVYDVMSVVEGGEIVPECLMNIPNCGEACDNWNLHYSLNTMNDYVVAYLKKINFDVLTDIGISGHLYEILGLVENHIDEIEQKEPNSALNEMITQ